MRGKLCRFAHFRKAVHSEGLANLALSRKRMIWLTKNCFAHSWCSRAANSTYFLRTWNSIKPKTRDKSTLTRQKSKRNQTHSQWTILLKLWVRVVWCSQATKFYAKCVRALYFIRHSVRDKVLNQQPKYLTHFKVTKLHLSNVDTESECFNWMLIRVWLK